MGKKKRLRKKIIRTVGALTIASTLMAGKTTKPAADLVKSATKIERQKRRYTRFRKSPNDYMNEEMLSFHAFSEAWSHHKEKIPKRPWQFLKQQIGPGHIRIKHGEHTYEHNQEDNRVALTHTGHKKYDVSYETKNFGPDFVKHLHSKVDEFVQTVKPRSINFASHKPDHQKAHAQMAQDIAQKHNGKISKPDEFTHKVDFK